jgi:hypothetical protein
LSGSGQAGNNRHPGPAGSKSDHLRRMGWLRLLRRVFLGACAFLVFVSLALWYIGVFGGNIRVVSPGKVYRSAQLTDSNLRDALKSRKVATVLNLRGAETADDWYKDEARICRQLGVDHDDVAFSATRLPPPAELTKLFHDFDAAKYPLILHCMGGSDRAGLASTIFLNVYQGVPLDQAEQRELTWRYGHLSWSKAGRMDDFFNLYRKTARGEGLREWVARSYPALYREEHKR